MTPYQTFVAGAEPGVMWDPEARKYYRSLSAGTTLAPGDQWTPRWEMKWRDFDWLPGEVVTREISKSDAVYTDYRHPIERPTEKLLEAMKERTPTWHIRQFWFRHPVEPNTFSTEKRAAIRWLDECEQSRAEPGFSRHPQAIPKMAQHPAYDELADLECTTGQPPAAQASPPADVGEDRCETIRHRLAQFDYVDGIDVEWLLNNLTATRKRAEGLEAEVARLKQQVCDRARERNEEIAKVVRLETKLTSAESSRDSWQERCEAAVAEGENTRDAIRLVIGMWNNRPWHEVSSGDVDSYCLRLKRLKSLAPDAPRLGEGAK